MTNDILYVGSTTLDYIFPDRIGIISGSAARSAAATAMANPNDTKIGLITALGHRGSIARQHTRYIGANRYSGLFAAAG